MDATIHAPISLLPTPFPRRLYEQSQRLQPLYNDLYARITLNDEFLERVVGGNVVLVDEFQARLWQLYKEIRNEGVAQVSGMERENAAEGGALQRADTSA